MSSQNRIAAALSTFNALDGNDIRALAEALGGSELAAVPDDALCGFARAIVEICASLGDGYSASPNDADGTAGDAIRAKFGVA